MLTFFVRLGVDRGDGVLFLFGVVAPTLGDLGVDPLGGLRWDVPAAGDFDAALAAVPRRAGDLALDDCALGGGERALEGVGERPGRETSEVVDVPGPTLGDVALAIREGVREGARE